MQDSRRDDVGLADRLDDLPDAGPALRNEAEVAGVKVEHRAVVLDQPQMAFDDDDDTEDNVKNTKNSKKNNYDDNNNTTK